MLLITGATGFVGSNLTQRLLRKGHDIRMLCLPTEDPGKIAKAKSVEVVYGDITKPETLRNALKGVDTVIHLAGLVSYSKPKPVLYKVNAVGTKNLLKFCKRVDKIIFSSSVSVYGEITGKADENYPIMPRTYYGESKYLAERLVQRSGIRSVILRIAPAYGKGSPSWLRNLRLLEKGFPIPNTKKKTHVIHVSDFVQALVRSVDKGEGVYNIADSGPIPFVEFAETVVRA
ncbi:MAG: NAD(P)-dependent oxidoreductase, partial [Thermoplasmata archaeon]|nr:NAD(P)-dependent oxidoreductase [Thermoplasmata archaeon]